MAKMTLSSVRPVKADLILWSSRSQDLWVLSLVPLKTSALRLKVNITSHSTQHYIIITRENWRVQRISLKDQSSNERVEFVSLLDRLTINSRAVSRILSRVQTVYWGAGWMLQIFVIWLTVQEKNEAWGGWPGSLYPQIFGVWPTVKLFPPHTFQRSQPAYCFSQMGLVSKLSSHVRNLRSELVEIPSPSRSTLHSPSSFFKSPFLLTRVINLFDLSRPLVEDSPKLRLPTPLEIL
jgi:hypothetical protein